MTCTYPKITVVHTYLLLYLILGPSDIMVYGHKWTFPVASDWPPSFLCPIARCFLAYNVHR